MRGDFAIPKGYEFLEEPCEQFLIDHPDHARNVFIMTRYAWDDPVLQRIDAQVRAALWRHGCTPLRADDKVYTRDRNLWNNVCVYMICSSYGVGILENRARDEFNPNVATEYGFMRALNKPVLLLVDRGFRNLRADVTGVVVGEFDIAQIESTIAQPVEQWLNDHRIALLAIGAAVTPLQEAAATWFKRVLKIWSARTAQETNDEFWYFGDEVERDYGVFTVVGASPEAATAGGLARHVLAEHDRASLRRLCDLLVLILRSGC